ncbi:D-alanine-D-alanine ligase A [Bacteroidales bacterium]|nr:D-alanine-D-alanine ligase A [Bacteroidales bacterium]
MNSKRNIAIVAGGDSSEAEVSLRSAKGLLSFIDTRKYELYLVFISHGKWQVEIGEGTKIAIDKNDFSFIVGNKKINIDFAYITIHGRPGEDGRLQGYFDLVGIPYSCCGVLTSALTFNKYTCNRFLGSFGIAVADSIRLLRGDKIENKEVENRLGLPVFVKPNDGGSSCGTFKVKSADGLQKAIEEAFKEGEEIIIERFMEGRELTCGAYQRSDKEIVLFPITEVISKNEFFDFAAKYQADRVEEITPAEIGAEKTQEVKELTRRIYKIIDAKGIIRIDYIMSPQGLVQLLEVNTTPGMTATSFIPQQIKAAGLDIREVMTEIIEKKFKKID